MCGITGICCFNGKIEDTYLLKKMTDSISHRGPDGEGFWISPDRNLGFGHRRLAIIDLSERGNQPMHYLNRYTIIFNGEIYNYIELKHDLLKKGYKFFSGSDTEVLLATYDCYKENCLGHLDGMFALAIWDEKEKTLFCARDRFGEKPFFYYRDDEKFVFASEVKALFAYGIKREVNEEMFYLYLAYFTMENGDKTFFRNIFELPQAHYLRINTNRKIEIKKYWDINPGRKIFYKSDEEYAEKFRTLFEESVRRRLRSDVPVGTSLSGGLDSSAVVCMIDKLKGREQVQKTFSARFDDETKDEGKWMQHVWNATRVEPYFVYPDPNRMAEELEQVCYHQEAPFSSASVYAQWCVMRLAKENGVTVLLDGQGADETLAGYHHYFFAFYANLLRKGKLFEYWKERKAFQKNFGQSFESINRLRVLALLKSFLKSVFFLTGSIPQKTETYSDIHTDIHRHYKDVLPPAYPYKNLGALLRFNTTISGLPALLRYADRNSMAHSREVRLPFLNHQLVEYLFAIPDEQKIHNGKTKYVMRNALRGILPDAITNRMDKLGYATPDKKWMKTPGMQELLKDSVVVLKKEKWLDEKVNRAGNWRELMVTMFLKM